MFVPRNYSRDNLSMDVHDLPEFQARIFSAKLFKELHPRVVFDLSLGQNAFTKKNNFCIQWIFQKKKKKTRELAAFNCNKRTCKKTCFMDGHIIKCYLNSGGILNFWPDGACGDA